MVANSAKVSHRGNCSDEARGLGGKSIARTRSPPHRNHGGPSYDPPGSESRFHGSPFCIDPNNAVAAEGNASSTTGGVGRGLGGGDEGSSTVLGLVQRTIGDDSPHTFASITDANDSLGGELLRRGWRCASPLD